MNPPKMTHRIDEIIIARAVEGVGRPQIGFECVRCKMIWDDGANPTVLEELECLGPTALLPK